MKVRSDSLPQNNFEINNIQDNKCDVVFFDVSKAVEETDENGVKSYEYESYKINTTYRSSLGADISNNYEKWYNYAVKYNYDALASEIRAKRDELLKDSDKFMLFDRMNLNLPTELNATTMLASIKEFFQTLSDIKENKWAKYRQELRDITKQPGFPYNVEFPNIPEENEE